MPRKPTGRPRGRPQGTGQLDNPARLTVWMNGETYARLEAYADGRHYHRGEPQLSSCVRELLVHALACPYKYQTQNIPVLHMDTNKQIGNEPIVGQDNYEQIETIVAVPENNYYEQIETVPLVTENIAGEIENVPTYDTTKHRLGKLCPRGHEWGSTGKSLRFNTRAGGCLACEAERLRKGRQAESQAKRLAERQATAP
jgi:hypothetical protein